MKKILLSLCTILCLLSACKDPFLNQTFIIQTDDETLITNAAYFEKRKEDFSMWIELLKYADMYNALNDANTITTVFAPNNEAMQAFLKFKKVSSVQELDFNYAREVVKVHILKSSLNEASFIVHVNSGLITIPTIFGTYLTTSYGYTKTDVDDKDLGLMKPQDTLSIYLNNQANVLELAKTTVNGSVYVLGGVIRPLSETIVEKMRDYGEYQIFINAIEKTGWDKPLAVYQDTTYELNGSYSVSAVNYTCFAVPDSIYNLEHISNVEDLIAKVGAGTNYTDSTNALYQYVAYHLLNRRYNKSELFKFQKIGETNITDTKLKFQVITSNMDNDNCFINENISILRSDIESRNGLIHKIDKYMPVWAPKPVTVIWDFCNYPDIESFVNGYGAANNLGNLFSAKISAKEYQIDLSDVKSNGNFGTISSFDFVGNTSKTSYSSWRKVGFMKCKYLSVQEDTINTYGANMDNLLILNLGYAGWISMKTPTIIKGKYRVEFYYAGSVALKPYYTSGSLVKFTLDDYLKSLYVWKGINPDAGSHIHPDVLFNEVVFENSESHTLKAVMMDIKAKTNSPYRQMWDYIKFIPITE